MTTLLVTHDDCTHHLTPAGHPERVARLEHLMAALEGKALTRIEAPEASDDDVCLVHPQVYLDRIRASEPKEGIVAIDADTHMSPGSFAAAMRAVGGALQAVDMVMAGEAANAFVATRPPGHHAETETPMGFCLFGNAAIAAKHALDRHGLSRVAVVDFDVHHGNGTQDLLWSEARTLFVSSHQMPLWPGTGAPEERGAHDNVINVPLAPQTGGDGFRKAYEAQVFPGAGRVQAGASDHLGRVRCPQGRSAGQPDAGRGRFRLGHPQAVRDRRTAWRRPRRLLPRRGL